MHGDGRGGGRAEQALDGEIGLLAGAGGGRTGRAEDAELPAHLVLRGRGPGRGELVALVQDGVGGEPGEIEGHDRSPAGFRAGSTTSASSVVTTASQLVRPRTCRKYARASTVSRCVRAHSLPGKAASIRSRQPRIGIR